MLPGAKCVPGRAWHGAKKANIGDYSTDEQRRQARAESREKNAEEARKNALNCEVMRKQKASIEPSPRVMVDDGNGGTRRLDDAERQDLLNEVNNYLAENCRQ